MTKFVIFGLGMVGRSFLRLASENSMIDSNWYVVEKNPDCVDIFLKYGGKAENFKSIDVNPLDYEQVFSFLDKGDYLLDMSSCQNNTGLLLFCMERDIHYLSTCSLPLEENDCQLPDYHDFCIYRQLKKLKTSSTTTSVIEFGMNPGLVSCFAKQALKIIVNEDDNPYIVANRQELKNIIKQNKFALLAQKLGLEIIQISDIDKTQVNFTPEKGCIYSPWNPEAFRDESINFTEISLGSDIDPASLAEKIYQYEDKDGFLRINKPAIMTEEQSFSPWGSFIGHIVPHEEIYTIGHYFSIYDGNGKAVYKPTCLFVYRPCETASQSLETEYKNNFSGHREHLISLSDISNGGESVGVVLEGKNFQTRYFGNKLEVPLEHDSPTILQVSAPAFAAFLYMLKFPDKGLLFPEELDSDIILEYAKPYLKEYVSFTCPKLERKFFKQTA